MHIQNLINIYQFALKILSGNEIVTELQNHRITDSQNNRRREWILYRGVSGWSGGGVRGVVRGRGVGQGGGWLGGGGWLVVRLGVPTFSKRGYY